MARIILLASILSGSRREIKNMINIPLSPKKSWRIKVKFIIIKKSTVKTVREYENTIPMLIKMQLK